MLFLPTMRMNEWRLKAPLGACCLLAFAVSFLFFYGALCIWLLAFAWIIRGRYLETLRNLLRSIPFWLWVCYFLLHAFSYFYNTNKEQSIFDSVGKLSFVLLPFIIGAGVPLTLRGTAAILLFFVAGLICTEIYCLWQAYSLWRIDKNVTHFFYHALTRGLDANAVYMAWYVTGALSALLLFPWREAACRWVLWWRWPAVLLFSGFIVLLASRLLLVVYPLVVLPAFGFRLFRRYKFWVLIPFLAFIIALFIGLNVLTRTNNPIHKRYSDIMHPDMSVVLQDDYHGAVPNWTNLTLRLFVWRIALENMETHHLWWRGTGNGDAHLYQNARIASHGIPNMQDQSIDRSDLYNVNLHNMYLQSLLMFGIPGLAVFLLIVLLPLFYLRRAGAAGWFFAIFHLIAILFFLQEAALQTQAGVIYYCFFVSAFWAAVKNTEKSAPAGVIQR